MQAAPLGTLCLGFLSVPRPGRKERPTGGWVSRELMSVTSSKVLRLGTQARNAVTRHFHSVSRGWRRGVQERDGTGHLGGPAGPAVLGNNLLVIVKPSEFITETWEMQRNKKTATSGP